MVRRETTDRSSTEGGERALPPVAEMAVATMVLVVTSGIFIAAHLPRPAPLGLPIALVGVSAVLLVLNLVSLSRVKAFDWDTFFLVGRWAFLAYLVTAGMLEFVFIFNHTPSDVLALLTVTLVLFAVDIPLLLAFSVARYQPPNQSREK